MQARSRTTAGAPLAKRLLSGLGIALLASFILAPVANAEQLLLDPVGSSCHPNDIHCAVKKLVDEGSSTVDEVTKPVVKKVEETVSTVEKTVQETLAPPSVAPDAGHQPRAKNRSRKSGKKNSAVRGSRYREVPVTPQTAPRDALSGKTVRDLMHSSAQSLASATIRASSPNRGVAAREIASKLAFPLLLTLLLGMFLLVQNRIDRREAKLVLAPLQAEEELLSFQ